MRPPQTRSNLAAPEVVSGQLLVGSGELREGRLNRQVRFQGPAVPGSPTAGQPMPFARHSVTC